MSTFRGSSQYQLRFTRTWCQKRTTMVHNLPSPIYQMHLNKEYPIQNLTDRFEKVAMEDGVARISNTQVHEPMETTTKPESITAMSVDYFIPPKVIFILRDRSVVHSVPFAQLGYDRQEKTIVPMLHMSSNGRMTRGRRGFPWATPYTLSTLLVDSDHDELSEPSSDGTVSTLTHGHGLVSDDSVDSSLEPINLGDECNTLLLKRDATHLQSPSCTDALLNMVKSAKKIGFGRKRMKLQYEQVNYGVKRCAYHRIN